MSAEQSILNTFFEECEDLLFALTDGLAAIADGDTEGETVNAVFRSVHSIKGAAGAFQMTDLVTFAHKFENVLDALRSNAIEATPDLVRVLQRSGDILADLVDAARHGTTTNTQAMEQTLEALKEFLAPEDADAGEFEFAFAAVGISLDSPDAASDLPSGWVIRFVPRRELFDRGHDPLFLIAALAELGPLDVNADATRLPDNIDGFEWEESYLGWTLTLHADSSEYLVRDIFSFVEDLCLLEISPLLPEPAPHFLEVPLPLDLPPSDNASQTPEPAPPAEAKAVRTETASAKTTERPGEKGADKTAKDAPATLRVDLERVDRLINAVGELIINQSVIAQRIEEAGFPPSAQILSDLDDYKLLAREIQEGVMAIRAQPVKPLFQRMSRIAREVSDATGKKVQLLTFGEGTEVDKTVIERLSDPLTHMIRNAIDHGIEAPEVRAASGKDQLGTVRLSASHRSGSVLIEISDDGAGLNQKRIRETAIRKGLIAEDADLSESEVNALLFAPGFSTATEVTNLSGRGVGMDVVKTAITALGGRISISTRPGKGTVFSIALPLTLAVMDGMIINVGDQTMVIPISSILESIRPTEKNLSKIGTAGTVLSIRGTYVPVVDLAASLGRPERDVDLTSQVLLLVRTDGLTQCALAVDRIIDQRQVVIKSLTGNYDKIPGVSGATILGDGKIALIVDPDAIVSTVGTAAPRLREKWQEKESTHAATA